MPFLKFRLLSYLLPTGSLVLDNEDRPYKSATTILNIHKNGELATSSGSEKKSSEHYMQLFSPPPPHRRLAGIGSGARHAAVHNKPVPPSCQVDIVKKSPPPKPKCFKFEFQRRKATPRLVEHLAKTPSPPSSSQS